MHHCCKKLVYQLHSKSMSIKQLLQSAQWFDLCEASALRKNYLPIIFVLHLFDLSATVGNLCLNFNGFHFEISF